MPLTPHYRAGWAALAAGFALVAPGTAAGPDTAAVKRTTDVDTAALNKLLNGGKPEKNAAGTIKSLALMLAAYGQQTGNADLTAGGVKVAEAAAKKDWAGASAAAKALPAGSGGAAPKGPLYTLAKYDLADAMHPFLLPKSSGLGMEKDIKEGAKAAAKVDPTAAELLGVRSAVLAEFTANLPNEEVKTPADKAKWKRYSDDMLAASHDLSAEGSKGKTADGKKLSAAMKKLDGSCAGCHADFRGK